MTPLYSDVADRRPYRTRPGIVIGHHRSPLAKQRIRAQLQTGPFLDAFDAGLYDFEVP